MQHESMCNGYVTLFQVKITIFLNEFLRLNHEVLLIKSPQFYSIFCLLEYIRIFMTPPSSYSYQNKIWIFNFWGP